MSKSSLVALDPPDILTFQLIRDNGPKVILKITNISQYKIIFKVKTTQPSWYFVRPNQQVLDINGSEEVSINLIASESNRYLEMTEDEKEGTLSKHRFLVQTKIITDDVYNRISSIPQSDRIDEYQSVWDNAPKEELKNHKLKVEFNEVSNNDFKPSNDLQSRQYPNLEPKNNNNNIQIDTNTSTNATPRQQNTNYHHEESSQTVPGSPESIYAELQSLRKKYDAVVEYTVHLTAERDYHFTQLEELKKQVTKERLKKNKSNGNDIGNNQSNGGVDGQQQGGKKEVIVQQGFSFIIVIIIAVLSFLIAKYTS